MYIYVYALTAYLQWALKLKDSDFLELLTCVKWTSLKPNSRTQTKEESLANSLLTWIDPKNATADEIREAFCRDIDAFSFEFQVKLV